MTDTSIPAEAPQIAQDAASPEQGTEMPSLEELARQAALMARTKGMTMAERVMVLDGWAQDTFGFLAALIATLQGQVEDLYRMFAELAGSEQVENLPRLVVEQQAGFLAEMIARARVRAELDYLEQKPGPEGPRLLVP